MADATSAMYERDGSGFVGSHATAGAWSPDQQAGSAVLALLAHVAEDVPTLTPMSVARLTADLFRPVPVGRRIFVDVEVRREGKKIQLVDMVVRDRDTELAVARYLRVRDVDLTGFAEPAGAHPLDLLNGPTDDSHGVSPHGFVTHGVEMRRSTRSFDGRHASWIRLRAPSVVSGEAVRPASLAALAMDTVNLLGASLRRSGVLGANPDVSGHLYRMPSAGWVGAHGTTWFDPDRGHGVSSATLFDEVGHFGVASTSALIQVS